MFDPLSIWICITLTLRWTMEDKYMVDADVIINVYPTEEVCFCFLRFPVTSVAFETSDFAGKKELVSVF